MLKALIRFLVGCLVLAVVAYVAYLVLGLLALPPAIHQIAVLILALIGLLVLIGLAISVFRGGGGNFDL